MPLEFDPREAKLMTDTATRLQELHAMAPGAAAAMAAAAPPHVAHVSPLTGSPTAMSFGKLQTSPGTAVQQAMDLVSQANAAFGFESAGAGAAPQYIPDPNVQTTSAGTTIVHLQQHYHGIPIFQMTRAVQMSPDGTDVLGDSISLQGMTINTQPRVEVEDAMRAAAGYLATSDEDQPTERKDHWGQTLAPVEMDLSDYQPHILAKFDLATEPTVLDKGPFGDVTPVHLVLFYDGTAVRLAWNFLITMPDFQGQYRVLVAADKEGKPDILYCKSTASSVNGDDRNAQGRVYTHNPGTGKLELIDFPRKLKDYLIRDPTVPLPTLFPPPWVEESETSGSNVRAVFMKNPPKTVRGKPGPGGKVVFNAKKPDDNDQKVINLFYFCNFMHDFYYMLGFTPNQENFEGAEAVQARVFPVPVRGTANMLTPVHGAPTMNMGLVSSSQLHTALDSDVVFHEWTHGISNRLIGGRLNVSALEQPQSSGMGEGWSDYLALTIYNFGKDKEKTVTGDWVVNNEAGIRSFPYDATHVKERNFSHLPKFSDEHDVGEVWCDTLMDMNRQLGAVLGSAEEAHLLGWQLVVDSFKLMPANPSFLHARDSIVRALDDMRANGRIDAHRHQTARKAIWTVFAKFGMGPNATSNGAYLSGIKADFSLPPEAAPASAAPAPAAAMTNDRAQALATRILGLPPEKLQALETLLGL